MCTEDAHMFRHLAFTEAVDFVQEVVEDLVDGAWHIIRKMHLARRKMHKQSTAPGASRPSLVGGAVGTTGESVPTKSPPPALKESRQTQQHSTHMTNNSSSSCIRRVRWSDAGVIEDALSMEDISSALSPSIQPP